MLSWGETGGRAITGMQAANHVERHRTRRLWIPIAVALVISGIVFAARGYFAWCQ